MRKGAVVTVGFVPTAGARTIVRVNGNTAPFFLGWPVLKWILDVLKHKGWLVTTELVPELKCESADRVRAAAELFKFGRLDYVVFSGGASVREKSVVTLMEECFAASIGQLATGLVLKDDRSVQTAENAQSLRDGLKQLDLHGRVVRIILITSWYHLPRTDWMLRRALPGADIRWHPVFPRLSYESLKDEYGINVLSEPAKLLVSLFPWFITWYGKRERKSSDRKLNSKLQ